MTRPTKAELTAFAADLNLAELLYDAARVADECGEARRLARHITMERYISHCSMTVLAFHAMWYATEATGKRWPEAEPLIKTEGTHWEQYCDEFEDARTEGLPLLGPQEDIGSGDYKHYIVSKEDGENIVFSLEGDDGEAILSSNMFSINRNTGVINLHAFIDSRIGLELTSETSRLKVTRT